MMMVMAVMMMMTTTTTTKLNYQGWRRKTLHGPRCSRLLGPGRAQRGQVASDVVARAAERPSRGKLGRPVP